ncbi:MAG: ROK family protein [Bacteroidota bacterium]
MDKLEFLVKNKNSNLKNRQLRQQRNIVRYLAKADTPLSIPEISEFIKTSVPTGTKLTKGLLENKYVVEEGKKETDNGRRPTTYALNSEKFYVIGVEILEKFIHASVVNIDLETIHQAVNRDFKLEDSEICLNEIIQFIRQMITDSGVHADQIIGVGIGMTGSVNGNIEEPVKYFAEEPLSLKQYLERGLNWPVVIDNDTRAIGIAEQVMGKAKGVENALIVKVSRKLGLSIILNRQIILGGTGMAGNLAHMRFNGGERLCACGKQGCLGTEVSGDALLLDLIDAINNGEKSLYFQLEQLREYKYHDILDAVLNGDALAIKLLQKQGDKLGQALGNIVNLLNPDLIVIGGEFVMVQDFLLDAIKMGIRKTALLSSLNACKIEASSLGRYLSSKAGACMLLKACDMIDY